MLYSLSQWPFVSWFEPGVKASGKCRCLCINGSAFETITPCTVSILNSLKNGLVCPAVTPSQYRYWMYPGITALIPFFWALFFNSMGNHDLDAFLKKNHIFGGKMGVGAKGSGAKSWSTGWAFRVNHYLENLFSKISGMFHPQYFSAMLHYTIKFHLNSLGGGVVVQAWR